MSVTSTSAPPSSATWRSLCALLRGDTQEVEPCHALAEAAVLAEVECLALEALPALSPWLDGSTQRRGELAALVGFAEDRVKALMKSADIERWVALKGSASAYLIYDAAHHRARRDVDVLVHADDMAQLRAAAEQAGWEDRTHATHLAGTSDAPFEREFFITIGAHRVGCDVHERLVRWREFPIASAELIARAQTLESGWRVCDPIDLLLHTALHAANAAYRVPLRSFLDVHRIASAPGINWDIVVERAAAWRVRHLLWLSLIRSVRWFHTEVPSDALKALRPPRAVARGLTQAMGGLTPWSALSKDTGALARTWRRAWLRDSPKDALHYLWQTTTRELSHRGGS